MNIGIITFHFAHNCGAVLQCLALQESLKRMGHSVCIINYQPGYHRRRYAVLKNPFYFGWQSKSLMAFIKTLFSWRHYRQSRERYKCFSSFSTMWLNETCRYTSLEQLQKTPPACDMYISGSDQLWNTRLTENRIDPAYLLDFGSKSTRRITYSIGCSLSYSNDSDGSLRRALKNLQTISLREMENIDEIRLLTEGQTPLRTDIDPSLLLTEQDYIPYMAKTSLVLEPFIFTYTMPDPSQETVYHAARELSRLTGMKIVDASGFPQKANRQIKDHRVCGPAEFLWYIKNASYVITNSFHGTAFSIIFKKQFAAALHSGTGYRIRELLEKLSLEDHVVGNAAEALQVLKETCDYKKTDLLLKRLIADSKEYLQTQTSKVEICIPKY